MNTQHKALHTLQYMSRIIINIDILSSYLSNIEQSMLLARLKIVPTFIVNLDETKTIRQTINDTHFAEMSDENIFKLLDLETFMDETKINFRIKVPTFD